MIITMFIFMIYFIKIGQGGRDINNDNEGDGLYKDDDSKWILGSIYYNKNDPAMMIEKRIGIGWTINFANPKSIVFILVTLLMIILSTVFGVIIRII